MAAALADRVAFMEAGDYLTLAVQTRKRCDERLWQPVDALQDTTPFARWPPPSHARPMSRLISARPSCRPRTGAPSGQPL